MNIKSAVLMMIPSVLLPAYQLWAQSGTSKQDTTFSTKKIEMHQEYTPEVSLPPKPKWVPSEPNISSQTVPSFSYEVPPQVLHYSYGAVNIKPLALQPIPSKVSYQNYAGLGLGNLSTVFADLGLTYHQDGKYDAYLHGIHFSQKKGKIDDRQSSVTDVIAGGKYYFKNYVINGDIHYNRRGGTYYGYNHELHSFDKEDILQAYNTISLNAGLDKFTIHEQGIGFQPQVSMYLFNIKTGGNETGVEWNAPLTYNLNQQLEIGIGVSGFLSSYDSEEMKDRNNSYFQINPYLHYTKDKFLAHIGFSPVTTSRQGWSFLPNINLRYGLGDPARAAISAGWDGDVAVFSYRNLSEKNPFIYDPWVDNGIHRRLYGGLELALISNFKLEARATYHTFSRYAVFTNDYVRHPAGNTFRVDYIEDLSMFEFYAGAHILLSNKFDLGANFSFYTFNEDSSVVYHEPKLDFSAYMKVRPVEWLTLGADLKFLNGMKYLDLGGYDKKLDPAFNLGLYGQVDFLKRFSVFLNLDNILDSKYQRWNQYNVYGFNIFGGLKVKF